VPAAARTRPAEIPRAHSTNDSSRRKPHLSRGIRRFPAISALPCVDICPFTGRARLSYRRAEEIFRDTSGGWTPYRQST